MIWIVFFTVSTFKMQTHTNLGVTPLDNPSKSSNGGFTTRCIFAMQHDLLKELCADCSPWMSHSHLGHFSYEGIQVDSVSWASLISQKTCLESTSYRLSKLRPSFALRIISALALATRNMSNFTQLLLTTPWRFSVMRIPPKRHGFFRQGTWTKGTKAKNQLHDVDTKENVVLKNQSGRWWSRCFWKKWFKICLFFCWEPSENQCDATESDGVTRIFALDLHNFTKIPQWPPRGQPADIQSQDSRKRIRRHIPKEFGLGPVCQHLGLVNICFSRMVFCGGSFSMNIYRYIFNTTFPSSKTTVKLYIPLKRSWRI